ncbi:MAG TPA: DUF885 domain-containing protein [Caulobacteraceae bacterium]
MSIAFSRRAVVGGLGAAALPVGLAAQSPEGGPNRAFAALSARWLEATTRLSPISATQLGDHRFDAEIDDVSPAGRAAADRTSRALLADLMAINRARLSRANQIDAAMLANQLRYDIWTRNTLQDWAWDPLIYNSLAGDALYTLMARDFAPIGGRLASATARMEKIPALLAQARRNLDPARVPLVHAQTVAKQNKGISGLVSELITPHAKHLYPESANRLAAATRALDAAVSEHQDWIDKVLVPGAKGDFRLGARLYDAKLAFVLDSPLSRQEIRTRADAAVIATRIEMYALARTALAGKPGAPATPDSPTPEQQQAVIAAALDIAAADHPARDQVVEAAKQGLAEATAFVKARDLITLPASPVQVILMPVFQRGVAVAYCDAPGPLDRRLATFYAVSPIPDDWTAARTESFLREYNRRGIDDIATHEAMPGHYVQLAHSNAFPSVLRSVLSSGPFVEGWAVYAESMMAQEGFQNGDPLYKLVVLKTKLRSITNAILDQAIHVDGMSREDAMKLMMQTAFQEEGEASGKWIRASVSSAQLPYYFVGSEEHWGIRREAEKRWGAGFSLKRYHDTVLSFGSPPARLARAAMFDEAIGEAR